LLSNFGSNIAIFYQREILIHKQIILILIFKIFNKDLKKFSNKKEGLNAKNSKAL